MGRGRHDAAGGRRPGGDAGAGGQGGARHRRGTNALACGLSRTLRADDLRRPGPAGPSSGGRAAGVGIAAPQCATDREDTSRVRLNDVAGKSRPTPRLQSLSPGGAFPACVDRTLGQLAISTSRGHWILLSRPNRAGGIRRNRRDGCRPSNPDQSCQCGHRCRSDEPETYTSTFRPIQGRWRQLLTGAKLCRVEQGLGRQSFVEVKFTWHDG